MKLDTKTIVIAGLILLLVVSGFFNFDNTEVIDGLEKRLEREQAGRKHREDSLVKAIHRNDERLLKMMREDAEKDMIVADAVADAKRYKKRYEDIKYIRYTSDSARNAALRSALGR